MTKTLLTCGLLAAIGAAAADGNLSGPLAGYVADSSRPVLRAITGVPGSYLFSDPIGLPGTVTRVHVASGQDFALAQRGAEGIGILHLRGRAGQRFSAIGNGLCSRERFAGWRGRRRFLQADRRIIFVAG